MQRLLGFYLPESLPCANRLRDFLRVLRRLRAYDRVPPLHLERERSLWLRNLKKDLSFVIGGEGAPQTVLLPRRLPLPRRSLTSMRRPPIRPRAPAFPSPFHRSSFRWAVPR